MGCAASRDGSTTFVTVRDPSPSLSGAQSSTPSPPPPSFALLPDKQQPKVSTHRSSAAPPPPVVVVHHLPLRPGDSHHLVSLTSTTYGSLFLLDQPSSRGTADAVTAPHVKEEKEDAEQRLQATPTAVINAWELMDGLDDMISPPPASTASPTSRRLQQQEQSLLGSVYDPRHLEFQPRSASFDHRQRHAGAVPKSPPKPLWKHLSEESLLEDMDPSVASTLRRSFSYTSIYTPITGSSTTTQTLACVPKAINDLASTKVILYTTSLRGVRRTYEDCCAVRSILRAHRAAVDERDVSMDAGYRRELQTLMMMMMMVMPGSGGRHGGQLPQVFVGRNYVGGADEIRRLEETGELAEVIREAVRVGKGMDEVLCVGCGGARFVPCAGCRGSRKVFDEAAGQVGRCSRCNENGLVRCPCCCSCP